MPANNLFRYRLSKSIHPAKAEATLVRALFAVESLHGEVEVRMHARHSLDESGRICVIDATTDVGSHLCRLFTGFLMREHGDDAFRVERISLDQAAHPSTKEEWNSSDSHGNETGRS